MSGFALFYLQDPSVLEFQRRFEGGDEPCKGLITDQIHMNNLTNVFGINNIPGDAQLRNILDTHSYDALLNIFPDFFRRMQRNKSLDQFQFLYFTSSSLAQHELQMQCCLHFASSKQFGKLLHLQYRWQILNCNGWIRIFYFGKNPLR